MADPAFVQCDVIVKHKSDGTIVEHRNTHWRLLGIFGDVDLRTLEAGDELIITRTPEQQARDGGS